MAVKKVYIGSVGPFLFDDGNLINDPDGDFSGEYQKGLTTDASLLVDVLEAASLDLGTGELTAGSINRVSGSLTLEIGGTAVVTVASASVTLAQTAVLSNCVNAGTDTDKFLVLDGSNNIDYRTGAEVLSDIGASSVVVTPITWNMLTMNPTATGQGTWDRGSDAFPYYGYYYNTSAANGDNITCTFSCQAGTYTLRTSHVKYSDAGICDIYIDDSEEGSIDLYSAGAGSYTINEISGLTLSDGSHTIKFQVDGKNGSSSGYYLTISQVEFRRTGA